MSNNSNLAIGAGVGAVAGAGVGFKIGKDKAAQALETAKNTHVGNRVAANFDNIVDTFKSTSRRMKAFGRVAHDAADDFVKSDAAKNIAKTTKAKWIAGIAAVGAAIGVGVAAIYNKVRASKEEKAETQA